MLIQLYTIGSLKEADGKEEEFKKFKIGTRSFYPYKPHDLFKDHCATMYYPWINGACHWREEDPWRYCYNSSKLNELVSFTMESLTKLKVVAIIVVASSKPMQDIGKREIGEDKETEQS